MIYSRNYHHFSSCNFKIKNGISGFLGGFYWVLDDFQWDLGYF